MKPVVDNRKYRMQSVDLQPYGNTISVECPSDNPFEDAQDVEIVTQGSGDQALSGPDPRMKSKRILTQGKRLAPIVAGKAKVRMVVAHAAAPLKHNGFIPGMSGLGSVTTHKPFPRTPLLKRTAYPPHATPRAGGVQRSHTARFIPGMGAFDANGNYIPSGPTPAQPVLMAQNPSQPAVSFQQPAQPSGFTNFLNALTPVAQAASAGVVATQQTEQQKLAMDAANADRSSAAGKMGGGLLGGKMPLYIGGGIALLAAIYFLTKPKKA